MVLKKEFIKIVIGKSKTDYLLILKLCYNILLKFWKIINRKIIFLMMECHLESRNLIYEYKKSN